MMEKPFAITLDVGSSLANKTGSWRTERAVYVDRLPPCNHACPAGENIQAWLYEAEEGGERLRARLAEDRGGQPVPGDHGAGLLPPVRDLLQPRPARRGGRHQLGRALPRRRGDREGWRVEVEAEPSGKRVLVVGAGPSGLSAAYHLARRGHAVTIREAGPMAGGMMRFGIPKYRLPRDVLDAEVQRILDLGVELELNRKVDGRARDDGGGRLRRRLPRGRRPDRQARLHPRRGGRARPRRSLDAARAWRATSGRCSAAVSRSTAAATRRWTRRAPRSGSAPPRRSSSTAATATGCRRTSPRSRRPRRRGC